LRRSRINICDFDVVAERLLLQSQRSKVGAQAEFSGTIGRANWHRKETGNARNVDNMTLFLLDEMRQQKLGESDAREQIDVDHFTIDFEQSFMTRTTLSKSCIILHKRI
jgi:hypothetical protein